MNEPTPRAVDERAAANLSPAIAPTVRVHAALAHDAMSRAADEPHGVSVGDRVVHDALRARLFGATPEPTRVGRFVIVRKLGAGGMGVVYSAYDDYLDRKVAIKLLHSDSSGSQGRARILREAQAVARLSHPNIVQVYEVGELASGQVFMAMEFVEGVTLAAWAQRATRTWREVLAVYVQVAEGLAAAHEQGLVHRDVKPENVLVSDRGRVVILDFGLARLHRDDEADTLDNGLDGAAATGGGSVAALEAMSAAQAEAAAQTLTASGLIMGTPAYMSPEQCTGLPADARSDQFSFCVSLYEALYGERPFAGRDLARLIFAVCHGELRDAPRGTRVPTWLRRVLVRGLAVKPSDRWPSMHALAEALSRDPARQRRRWLGAGAVTSSLLLGALGTVQPWSSDQLCHGADARLRGIWDAPRKPAVRDALAATGYAYAAQSWPLLESRLDEYAGGWAAMYTRACEAHQRGETSGELYDRQMACLDARLGELQSTVNVLASADATVLQQASDMVSGLAPLSVCGDTDSLRESYAPPGDQKTADAVRALRQQLVDIRVRADSGHAFDVLESAEAVARAAETLGYRPLHAEALFQLGMLHLALHRGAEAQRVLLDAFLKADAVRHDEIAAKAGAWLVFLSARAGHETEAKLRAEHVSAVLERYGRTSVADLHLQRGLATLDYVNGRYDEARRGLRHALAIADALPEAEAARQSTLIHVNIGQVCEMQGDIACMSSNFERAMEQISSRVGRDDPKLTMFKYMLAKARLTQGRYDEARALVESGVSSTRDAFGERHPLYVESLMWAAEIMHHDGEIGDALQRIEEARAVNEKLGEDAHERAYLDVMSASVLRSQGRYDEALTRIERALERDREALTGSPFDEKLRNARAELLSDTRRYAEAKAEYEALLAASGPVNMSFGPYFTRKLVGLAHVERMLDNDERAAELLAEARAAITSISAEHWALTEPLRETAELALKRGELDEALAAATRALAILESGCSRLERPRVRFLVARVMYERAPEEALALAERALVEESELDQPAPSRRAEIEAWLEERRPQRGLG
ncbi:MAG: protein kinase [Myxococcales bacterium]|nr:protein kinase [Myxococcales bacterium]